VANKLREFSIFVFVDSKTTKYITMVLAFPRSYDNLRQDQYATISFDNLFPFPALNVQL
jgi:hypothetical protein